MYVCTCCMCVYMCLYVYICMYLFNSVHMGRDQKLTMGLFLIDLILFFETQSFIEFGAHQLVQ